MCTDINGMKSFVINKHIADAYMMAEWDYCCR